MKILAVVPAKARSNRVPGKNWRMLGDRPLWRWTWDAVVAAPSVDWAVVSSDRAVNDPNVEFMWRGAPLCEDDVPATAAVKDVLDTFLPGDFDGVMMCLPTSPFRNRWNIERVVARWTELGPDSVVVTVTPAPDLKRKLRRVSVSCGQLNRPPLSADWCVSNGAVQLTSVERFLTPPIGFWGGEDPVYGEPLTGPPGWDIDTEDDWTLAARYAARLEQETRDRAKMAATVVVENIQGA